VTVRLEQVLLVTAVADLASAFATFPWELAVMRFLSGFGSVLCPTACPPGNPRMGRLHTWLGFTAMVPMCDIARSQVGGDMFVVLLTHLLPLLLVVWAAQGGGIYAGYLYLHLRVPASPLPGTVPGVCRRLLDARKHPLLWPGLGHDRRRGRCHYLKEGLSDLLLTAAMPMGSRPSTCVTRCYDAALCHWQYDSGRSMFAVG